MSKRKFTDQEKAALLDKARKPLSEEDLMKLTDMAVALCKKNRVFKRKRKDGVPIKAYGRWQKLTVYAKPKRMKGRCYHNESWKKMDDELRSHLGSETAVLRKQDREMTEQLNTWRRKRYWDENRMMYVTVAERIQKTNARFEEFVKKELEKGVKEPKYVVPEIYIPVKAPAPSKPPQKNLVPWNKKTSITSFPGLSEAIMSHLLSLEEKTQEERKEDHTS